MPHQRHLAGIKQLFKIINYLLGENTVTRTRLDISDGSRTAYIKRYAFLGIS